MIKSLTFAISLIIFAYILQSNDALAKNQAMKRDYIVQEQVKENVLFVDFINERIEKRTNRVSESTLKNDITARNSLLDFEKEYNATLFTNSISDEFLSDYVMFMQNKGLKQTYIKRIVGSITQYARRASILGYPVNHSFEDFAISDDRPFNVYLTTGDITRIYYSDHKLSRIQRQQKDLFIVGCWTGMRYSDYSKLTKDDFSNGFIRKTTQKTKTKVVIPIHDYIKEIFEKYDGNISRGTSIQQFDRIIKVIMKKIGFTQPISYTVIEGGIPVTHTKPKYELIASHTARRSFATNMYKSGRMKTYQIMACTGHSTEKSFFRYIDIDNEEIANQIAGDIIFKA